MSADDLVHDPSRNTSEDDDPLRRVRLEKLAALRDMGIEPYPVTFSRNAEAADLDKRHADLAAGAEVRGWAAHLLARLPGSALGQRMARRAGGCLRIDRGVRGTRLIVTPPAGCDAAMRRDGVMSRRGGGPAEMDDRTHLLHEVLARTPLRTWTGQFGRTPDQILAVPSPPATSR